MCALLLKCTKPTRMNEYVLGTFTWIKDWTLTGLDPDMTVTFTADTWSHCTSHFTDILKKKK